MQERAKRKGKGFIGFAAMQRKRRVGGLSSLNADQPTFSPISPDFPSGLTRKKTRVLPPSSTVLTNERTMEEGASDGGGGDDDT